MLGKSLPRVRLNWRKANGLIPVIAQDTPAVTKPQAVVEALKSSNLVALKNHGVVCIAGTFKEALHLIENLEDAVRTASVARLFKKEILGKKCRYFHPTKRCYETGTIDSLPYKISGHLKIKIRNVAGFVPLGDVQVDDG